MAGIDQEMTHDEIWDDSALIDSWDEALAEYKKYHSIHLNGGNVKDLAIPKPKEVAESLNEAVEPSENEEVEMVSEAKEDHITAGQGVENAAAQDSHPRVSVPPAPAGLLGTIRDEGLKRLLMSWYYAGYYTGYYEGQRDSPQNREPAENA